MILEKFENIHQKDRCFIIGNGPSLKDHDLSLLENEFVFTVNWFIMHEYYKKLKKVYYCISDKIFWDAEKKLYNTFLEEFNKNSSSVLFSYKIADPVINSESGQFKHLSHRVFFLDYDRSQPVWEGNFNTDITKTLCFGYTVVLDFCLPIAYYMGFKEVYLIGCDCDYNLKQDKNFNKSYFFNINDLPKENLDHLKYQRDNKGSQDKTDIWNLGYKTANVTFLSNNRILKNAGKGGKLEVLERINFESLFKG